jgi:5-(carboxyamino)imidazole ribonucleotide synthase
MASFQKKYRLGVLGGGQLGRMMIQAAYDLDFDVEVLDPSAFLAEGAWRRVLLLCFLVNQYAGPEAPCRHMTSRFVVGDLKDADTVYEFGLGLDVRCLEGAWLTLS